MKTGSEKRRPRLLPGLTVFLWLAAVLWTGGSEPAPGNREPDSDTLKIMPFISDSSACLECHDQTEMTARYLELAFPCDHICQKCHQAEMAAHHKTGMAITFKTRGSLRLGTGNRLICISCHDLTGPRFSPTPKKAQSLFQRMFKSQAKYKSYYLVVDNRNGQLCRMCH